MLPIGAKRHSPANLGPQRNGDALGADPIGAEVGSPGSAVPCRKSRTSRLRASAGRSTRRRPRRRRRRSHLAAPAPNRAAGRSIARRPPCRASRRAVRRARQPSDAQHLARRARDKAGLRATAVSRRLDVRMAPIEVFSEADPWRPQRVSRREFERDRFDGPDARRADAGRSPGIREFGPDFDDSERRLAVVDAVAVTPTTDGCASISRSARRTAIGMSSSAERLASAHPCARGWLPMPVPAATLRERSALERGPPRRPRSPADRRPGRRRRI